MQITHRAVSGYRIEIENCIAAAKGRGNTAITQDDLVACLGRKVTQDFRRHVSEMQTEGKLTRFTYRTDKGGYKVAYAI